MRPGLASWRTISREPGLLTIINFSNPPSKKDLHDLQFVLEDYDLHHSTNCYRTSIQRVLRFIEKTLRTESLYRYLEGALRDVIDLVNWETHHQEDDVEDAVMSLLSQHHSSQDQPVSTNTYAWFDSSYNHYSIPSGSHCKGVMSGFRGSLLFSYRSAQNSLIYILSLSLYSFSGQ